MKAPAPEPPESAENNPAPPAEPIDLERVARLIASHTPVTWPSESARRRAAVAIVLRHGAAGGVEALLIKRAEHPLDPWSGHVAFPGGHQDPEDDSLETAARRETLEEVGLRIAPDAMLGRLDDIHGGRLGFRGLTVSPFVYRAPEDISLTLSDEVAHAFWAPLDFLANPANVRAYAYPPDPMRRAFPSLPFDGNIIWGITFRMIGSLVRLFGVGLPTDEEMSEVE